MEVQDLSNHSQTDELSGSFDGSEASRRKSLTKKQKSFRIEDETPRLTDADGWLDILGSNDLKKKVIESGAGVETRPQRGDWIIINATGKLENGMLVEKHDNVTIIVGDSDIVQGLDLTVALMEKGELAEVIVPARLAYGEQGKPPEIPSNSVMHYEIRLVDVTLDEDVKLSMVQRVKTGDKKRERGNFWYSRGDFSTAVHCYRRALNFLDDDDQNFKEPSDDLENLLNVKVKVYNNLAAAQLKMDAYEAAIKSVNNALLIEPENVKALF